MVLSLPKKQDTTLPSNTLNAEKLLNSLTKRHENNEALQQMYHDHMLNYITRATPAEDPMSTVFYLPHQAVKNVKHRKTKWRIVFNEPSHETNVAYHKDVLQMGPYLLP
jgi:hypothetical protein